MPVSSLESSAAKQQQEHEQTSATTGCCVPAVSSTIDEAQAQEYANWFKALADPTRIRILNVLACHQEPLCVCDIVSHFNLGQPAISHHLKILRDARFVTATRKANFMYYSINHSCLSTFPQAAHLIMNS